MTYAQGLIRQKALGKTAGRWDYFGWDYILLLELALLGRIHQPEGPIFTRVLHDRSAALNTRRMSEIREWVDPTIKARILLPHWKWLFERVRVTGASPIPLRYRVRVLTLIAGRAWRTKRNLYEDLRTAIQMGLGKTDILPF
jgi:hypothetical protein